MSGHLCQLVTHHYHVCLNGQIQKITPFESQAGLNLKQDYKVAPHHLIRPERNYKDAVRHSGNTYQSMGSRNSSLWVSDTDNLALKRKCCELEFDILLLKMVIYIHSTFSFSV